MAASLRHLEDELLGERARLDWAARWAESRRSRYARALVTLEETEQRLANRRERLAALSPAQRGWPAELALSLVVFALLFEVVPASQMSGALFPNASPAERFVLDLGFVGSWLLPSLFLGDMLRRRRTEAMSWVDTMFACLALAIVFTSLALMLFTIVEVARGNSLQTAPDALLMTTFAMSGILIGICVTYYRESADATNLRFSIARLSRQVRIRARELRLASKDFTLIHGDAPSRRDLQILRASSGAPDPALALDDEKPALTQLAPDAQEHLRDVTRGLDVEFRGLRDGLLFFKRTDADAEAPLTYAAGLEIARKIASAIRSEGGEVAKEALLRSEGVRVG